MYIYIYMYVYMYVYTYVCICTHTHTHTHIHIHVGLVNCTQQDIETLNAIVEFAFRASGSASAQKSTCVARDTEVTMAELAQTAE